MSPKGTFIVLDEYKIAFAEICLPGTISNIGHSPEVEVNFVDSFRRKGWRVRGVTQILRRGSADFEEISPNWHALWSDLSARIRAIVMIKVSEVKLLSTPPYDDGVTEADMIALYKEKYAKMYP